MPLQRARRNQSFCCLCADAACPFTPPCLTSARSTGLNIVSRASRRSACSRVRRADSTFTLVPTEVACRRNATYFGCATHAPLCMAALHAQRAGHLHIVAASRSQIGRWKGMDADQDTSDDQVSIAWARLTRCSGRALPWGLFLRFPRKELPVTARGHKAAATDSPGAQSGIRSGTLHLHRLNLEHVPPPCVMTPACWCCLVALLTPWLPLLPPAARHRARPQHGGQCVPGERLTGGAAEATGWCRCC